MKNKKYAFGLLSVFSSFVFVLVLAGCGGGGGAGASGGGGGGTGGGGGCASPLPTAPSIATLMAGAGQVSVYVWPPSNYVTSLPTGYIVTANPGNIQVNASFLTNPIVVTGLTPATTYTFSVAAYNCAGTGPASPTSTATPYGLPGAPTGVSAVAGPTAGATVSFSAPTSNGGATITSYTVTSSPGNISVSGASSPLAVQGLTSGTSYTFTVKATNAGGTGPASTASNALVIPLLINTGPFFVAPTGSDSNPGTSGSPFKTITEALSVAKVVGTANTINVAAGTYYTGETFPLNIVNNVNMLGPIGGAASAVINGGSAYSFNMTGTATTYNAAVVIPPGITATLSGFTINGGMNAQVIVDGAASAVVASNVLYPSLLGDGMYVANGAKAAVTGNRINGNYGLYGGLVVFGNSTVTARNNALFDQTWAGVYVQGGGTAANSPVLDLGTATSPGGNTFTTPCGAACALNVGLQIVTTGNVVNASGNTWNPLVQLSSASGVYAVGAKGTVPSAVANGNNYAIDATTGTGLQF